MLEDELNPPPRAGTDPDVCSGLFPDLVAGTDPEVCSGPFPNAEVDPDVCRGLLTEGEDSSPVRLAVEDPEL